MFLLFSRFKSVFLLILIVSNAYGQQQTAIKNYSFAALEYSIGKTSTANVNFPKLNPQQGILFSFGTTNFDDKLEWARQLNHPKTGFMVSYVDMGNPAQVGHTITVLPFIDFKVLNKWSNKWNIKFGLGASYFNKIYDEMNNPNNKAITTHFTWAFRSNLYYKLLEKENYDLKLGVGYFHNSNDICGFPTMDSIHFCLVCIRN